LPIQIRTILQGVKARHIIITESQNDWVWKGPLKVIWSNNPLAQAEPPRRSCPDGIL